MHCGSETDSLNRLRILGKQKVPKFQFRRTSENGLIVKDRMTLFPDIRTYKIINAQHI